MNAGTPDFRPRVLEEGCEWAASDVADAAAWTEVFSRAEQDELEAAVAHAFSVSDDFMAIGKDEFASRGSSVFTISCSMRVTVFSSSCSYGVSAASS